MRIRATDILELLGAGASYDEILEDYPYLEREFLVDNQLPPRWPASFKP